MDSIRLYIANSSASLSDSIPLIKNAFDEAAEVTSSTIQAGKIDVLVVDAPYGAIPELGVGGYTPSAHLVYISLDSSKKLRQKDIYTTLVHELHHAMRWRKPGYGKTLREALLSEGLATLFEEECSTKIPIYAKVEITNDQINEALKSFDKEDYDHQLWFIRGGGSIPRWFGYSYGYRLAKESTVRLKKSASELVHESIDNLISS